MSWVDHGRTIIVFTVLAASTAHWFASAKCLKCLKVFIMDLYSDSSVDLMEGFSLAGARVDYAPPAAHAAAPAGALDDFGPPPAAPEGFGFVVPSLGMAPVRMHPPPMDYSALWASGMVPQFSGPRMSLAGPLPGSVEDLLARRAALDLELSALVSRHLFKAFAWLYIVYIDGLFHHRHLVVYCGLIIVSPLVLLPPVQHIHHSYYYDIICSSTIGILLSIVV